MVLRDCYFGVGSARVLEASRFWGAVGVLSGPGAQSGGIILIRFLIADMWWVLCGRCACGWSKRSADPLFRLARKTPRLPCQHGCKHNTTSTAFEASQLPLWARTDAVLLHDITASSARHSSLADIAPASEVVQYSASPHWRETASSSQVFVRVPAGIATP